MTLRCAIWAAVSNPSQAKEDKLSIQIQVQKGRELIAARGWLAAGEYVVPGKSRTRYISIYHAQKHIPQLHDLLEAASRGEFDLLFVYDLNRFRTLMRQVFDVLCDNGIQIYIHTNPREPVKISAYNEEQQAAVGMIVDLSNIISRNEISNIQRHFREKMPERIKRGLHAGIGGVPYGYRKLHPLDKQNPYVIETTQARVAVQIKDWFLAGDSLWGITRRLNEAGIPAARGGVWYPVSVRNVLTKPFYAGVVYFGLTKSKRDHSTGGKKITINPNPVYAKGLHKALWDSATYQLILDTLEKRGNGYKGDHTERFSSLLRCGVCGKTLHYDRRAKEDQNPFWRCSSRRRKHTFITGKKAVELIIPAIIDEIRNLKGVSLPPARREDPTLHLQAEVRDLEKRQNRLIELYETEQVDAAVLRGRLDQLHARLDLTRSLLVKTQVLAARKQTTRDALTQLQQLIDELPVYYREGAPAQVNASLRVIIDHITVSKEHKVKIHWKE